MRTLSLLSFLLAVNAFAAAPKATVLDTLHATFEASIDKAKAKLTCKSEWKETEATTQRGGKYRALMCGEAQLMAHGDTVFAVGLPLESKANFKTVDAAQKKVIAELAAACTTVRQSGPMSLFECPGKFTVAVVSNWNSKDDTHSLTALFGLSGELMPMITGEK